MLISEDTEHRSVGLLLGEETGVVLVVVLVPVYDDMLGSGDQAVLNATESSQ